MRTTDTRMAAPALRGATDPIGRIRRTKGRGGRARANKPARLKRTGLARPDRLDTRLIAAVQSAAGAMVHKSAGLLQRYYMWSDLYRRAAGRNDAPAAEEAGREVREAEVQLRLFLTTRLPRPA